MRLFDAHWLVWLTALCCLAPASARANDDRSMDTEPEPPVVEIPQAPACLSIGEIAAILSTTNRGEVLQGQVAAHRASTALVKAFALRMVTGHTAANRQVAILLNDLGAVPVETALGLDLAARAIDEVTLLHTVPPLRFDRFYMEQQIQAHERSLAMIDHLLLPSAYDGLTVNLLADARLMISNHLLLAEGIQQLLEPLFSGPLELVEVSRPFSPPRLPQASFFFAES